MKKRSFILFVLAAISVVFCIVFVAILEKIETDNVKSLYSEKVYNNSEKDISLEQNETEPLSKYVEEEATLRKQIKRDFDFYVFVGDSRYRGMEFMAEDNDIFICENGRGYDYLLEQQQYIKSLCNERTALIIGLGVNDSIDNVENYITTLNEMSQQMDCQIYYMLVNPVEEEKEHYNGYDVLNDNIEIFNKMIKEGLSENIGIIDTYSYLGRIGFETQDGLHYTNETYEDIYNYIKKEITE